MKHLLRMVLIIFTTAICLYLTMMIDDDFINIYKGKYDKQINITLTRNTKEELKLILESAKDKNLILSKITSNFKEDKEKKTMDIYLYPIDSKWFEKNISFLEIDKNETTYLTRCKVKFKDMKDIETFAISGDYQVAGSNQDIDGFMDELNNYENINVVHIEKNITSYLDFTTVINIRILLFIFLIMFMMTMVIYNGKLSKEIAVRSLLGHSEIIFALVSSFKLIIYPIVISTTLIMAILYIWIDKSDIHFFVSSIIEILLFNIILYLLVGIIQTVSVFIRLRKINIVRQLKGYKHNLKYIFSLGKVLTLILASLVLCSSLFSIVDYISLKPHLEDWKEGNKYGSMLCTWSVEYMQDSNKFENQVVPVLDKVWNDIDDNNGVLFFAPNLNMEREKGFNEIDKNEIFQGKYAFINQNYLDKFVILDERKKHELENIDEGEWVVLIPENLEIKEEDKARINSNHKWNTANGIAEIRERYIKIKGGQRFITLDSNSRLDEARVEDYILILIKGKELEADRDIKLPSLINGKLHPTIKDSSSESDDGTDIRNIVENNKASEYVKSIENVYDSVEGEINEILLSFIVNLIALIISLLSLLLIIIIERNRYIFFKGQYIDVSLMLGHTFIEIHRKEILSKLKTYIISFILFVCSLVFITNSIPDIIYTPREELGLVFVFVSLVIAVILFLALWLLELILMNRMNFSISQRLKERE